MIIKLSRIEESSRRIGSENGNPAFEQRHQHGFYLFGIGGGELVRGIVFVGAQNRDTGRGDGKVGFERLI